MSEHRHRAWQDDDTGELVCLICGARTDAGAGVVWLSAETAGYLNQAVNLPSSVDIDVPLIYDDEGEDAS